LPDHFSVKGKNALITGASMSIGRSLALAFADHGASIVVHYSADADAKLGLPGAARATADKVRSRGVKACLVEADLLPEGSGIEIVQRANAALGSVDILVVCASIQSRTPFLQVTLDEIQRHTAINFRATILRFTRR
jgi:glucose 1-dehydrogenase